jgi:hypothetical protein
MGWIAFWVSGSLACAVIWSLALETRRRGAMLRETYRLLSLHAASQTGSEWFRRVDVLRARIWDDMPTDILGEDAVRLANKMAERETKNDADFTVIFHAISRK